MRTGSSTFRRSSRWSRRRMTENGLPGQVYGRPKHLYGIYQKMNKQSISFEEVYDLTALRIVTDTKMNCYALVGVIHSLWRPVPGRFKDYIAIPKSNLYQSIHTTVVGPKGEHVEFQIRTEEMHRVAECGIAAHWKYKEQGHVDRPRQQDLRLAASVRGVASGSAGQPPIHGLGETGPLPRRGLRVHSQRHCEGTAARARRRSILHTRFIPRSATTVSGPR